MNTLKNKEIDKEKWLELLRKNNFASPFQTPEFYDLFNSTQGLHADVFALEEDGIYKSLVVVTIQKEKGLKASFSKRGIVFGGVLIESSGGKYLEALLKIVKNFYRNKIIYLEIRNHFDYGEYRDVFESSGYEYNDHLNVQLITKGRTMEEIMGGMKYNRRRQIKSTYEQGATVRQAESVEEIEALYKILDELYKTRVKLPLMPYNFFLNMFQSDIGKVFVVLHEGKIIGGSFCICYEGMSINTFYYCGERTYNKKIFATHLAVMANVEYAIEHDLVMLDFMGAGKPDEDYGVRKYKEEFGGDLVKHGRFRMIFNPLLYKMGILGLKAMSKLS